MDTANPSVVAELAAAFVRGMHTGAVAFLALLAWPVNRWRLRA
jgi:hypothetical protein